MTLKFINIRKKTISVGFDKLSTFNKFHRWVWDEENSIDYNSFWKIYEIKTSFGNVSVFKALCLKTTLDAYQQKVEHK